MSRERETRPAAGKHSGRVAKSNCIVSQDRLYWRGLNAYYAFLGAVVLYGVLIFLHDMNII